MTAHINYRACHFIPWCVFVTVLRLVLLSEFYRNFEGSVGCSPAGKMDPKASGPLLRE